MSTHLDRKAIKRPDAFMERAGGIVSFIGENIWAAVGGVAVLFAAGLGLTFYNAHLSRVAEESDEALYIARKLFPDAVAAATAAKDPKAEKAAPLSDADWLSKSKPGMDALEKVVRDFSGSRAAFEADLFLGESYLKHAQAAKAVEYFKHAADNAKPRASKPAALYALAYAAEAAKSYDVAIDAFNQVSASDNPLYKSDALLGLGRNYALKGDKPKALEAYEQVAKENPNSPVAKQAQLAGSRVR